MKKNKLKICLLLPTYFDPSFPSRPAITEIYGNCLPSNGHDITWIVPSLKKEEDFKKKKFNEIEIFSVYHPPSSSLFLKSYNFFKYYFKKLRLLNNIFQENKYDVIQVRNDVFDSLIALYIKNKYGIPFVFQYSFPKSARKHISSQKLYTKIYGILEELILKFILNKADLIFPISDWMKNDLMEMGIPGSKMMPLPMGVNIDLFSHEFNKDIEIRNKYNLNGKNVILYIGSLDKIRRIDVIIDAFKEVKSHRDDIKLLIVGDGNQRPYLEEMAASLKLKEFIVFTGKVPYFEVPHFISISDICLSAISPISLFKISSPTKLFEYMAISKPIVANKGVYEQDLILKKSKSGILVDFEHSSFAEGIIKLLNDPDMAKTMGNNGFNWVKMNRTYDILSCNVEEIYYKLLLEIG